MGKVSIKDFKIEKNSLFLTIVSTGNFRPHNALLQIKNSLSRELGKKHHIGVREIKIEESNIDFDLEKKPLKKVNIPFAKVKLKGKQTTIVLKDVDEEFLRLRAIVQSHFDRQGVNNVKMWRGTGGKAGQKMKKIANKAKKKTDPDKWASTLVEVEESSLNGWTTKESVAHSFITRIRRSFLILKRCH